MLSEKEYLNLMKKIPVEKCPDDLVGNIIEKSGILTQQKRQKQTSLFSEVCYGFACLIIVTLIIGIGMHQNKPIPKTNVVIASNTKTILQHIKKGTYLAFTGKTVSARHE